MDEPFGLPLPFLDKASRKSTLCGSRVESGFPETREIFITACSRPGSSYLPRGFLGELRAKRAVPHGRSVTPAASLQNGNCSEAMGILDRMDGDNGDTKTQRLAVIQRLKNLEPTQSLGRTFAECSSLLETRHAFGSNAPPDANPAMIQPSMKDLQPTSKAQPLRKRTTTPNNYSVTSTLHRKIEHLKSDGAERDEFFEFVESLKLQKLGNIRSTRNHCREHIKTVGTRYTADSRWQRQEREAIEKERRTRQAQLKAKQLIDSKIQKTKEMLLQPVVREERREAEAKKKLRDTAATGAWLVATIHFRIVDTMKMMLASNLDKNTVPKGQGSTERSTPPDAQTPKVSKPRDAVTSFVLHMKKVTATKKIKKFARDYLNITKIPLAIDIYMKAVKSVQRNFRALVLIRNYRRFICSLQWDSVIDEMVRDIDRLIRVAENEKADQRAGGKKRAVGSVGVQCKTSDLNSLKRERGELRGIPVVVKAELINKFTKTKEVEYSEKVVQYLRMQAALETKISDWVSNERFMEAALEQKTDIALRLTKKVEFSFHTNYFARGAGSGRAPKQALERTRAVTALQQKGEQVHIPMPVFPVVTDRANIKALVNEAKHESRTLVKQRLAVNDGGPAPWCTGASPSSPDPVS
eukprot:TRINITY_DN19998_c0_g1_i1.p1 TRINITY_DN19998_c0_g1~~TRINITY_DN19998_c0_g1_i1.p1  ORF type:complete len:639 (+),score=164.63 TRINITY_DN19998_c0_g1_i1:69-1985(+)